MIPASFLLAATCLMVAVVGSAQKSINVVSSHVDILPTLPSWQAHNRLLGGGNIRRGRKSHSLRRLIDEEGKTQVDGDGGDSSKNNCSEAPFLWKIRHKETGNHVGFGVGTTPLPKDYVTSEYTWTSIVNALNDSCQVYGELNMLERKTQRDIDDCFAIANQDITTIVDIPDVALRNKYIAIVANMVGMLLPPGSDPSQQQQMQNLFMEFSIFLIAQFNMFYNTPEMRDDFFASILTGETSTDMIYSILEYGRPAGALETTEMQCKLMADLNPSVDIFLADYDNFWAAELEESLTASYSQTISEFKCGNIDDIEFQTEFELLEGLTSTATGNATTTMLDVDNRNVAMAEKMSRILQNSMEPTLFAVGLDRWVHGNNSLENLLLTMGYSIERVQFYGANELENQTDAMCEAASAERPVVEKEEAEVEEEEPEVEEVETEVEVEEPEAEVKEPEVEEEEPAVEEEEPVVEEEEPAVEEEESKVEEEESKVEEEESEDESVGRSFIANTASYWIIGTTIILAEFLL